MQPIDGSAGTGSAVAYGDVSEARWWLPRKYQGKIDLDAEAKSKSALLTGRTPALRNAAARPVVKKARKPH